MEKRINRLVNKSFKKTLLDSPVPNEKVKFPLSRNKSKPFKWETIKSLPEPLKPTKYVPPQPTPKPRPKPTPKPRPNLTRKRPRYLDLLLKRDARPRRPPKKV